MLSNNSTVVNPSTAATILKKIDATPARSAWARGVKIYAAELIEDYIDRRDPEAVIIPSAWGELESALLNGADTWAQYSAGGCSLIYDGDIAERLCTPSEYKRTRGGELNPNKYETWLECQARALHQAARMIYRVVITA